LAERPWNFSRLRWYIEAPLEYRGNIPTNLPLGSSWNGMKLKKQKNVFATFIVWKKLHAFLCTQTNGHFCVHFFVCCVIFFLFITVYYSQFINIQHIPWRTAL